MEFAPCAPKLPLLIPVKRGGVQCTICLLQFRNAKVLRKHQAEYHLPNGYVCPYCGLDLTNRYATLRTWRTNIYRLFNILTLWPRYNPLPNISYTFAQVFLRVAPEHPTPGPGNLRDLVLQHLRDLRPEFPESGPCGGAQEGGTLLQRQPVPVLLRGLPLRQDGLPAHEERLSQQRNCQPQVRRLGVDLQREDGARLSDQCKHKLSSDFKSFEIPGSLTQCTKEPPPAQLRANPLRMKTLNPGKMNQRNTRMMEQIKRQESSTERGERG